MLGKIENLASGIRLNPGLDVSQLKVSFEKNLRLHIPGIINEEAANGIHNSLKNEIGWNLAYNDDEGQKDLYARDQQNMPSAERQAFHQKIMARARTGTFQYLYGSFAVGDAYKEGLIKDMFVARFFEFVNTPEMINLISDITGIKGIKRANMQATAYGPGHFLTDHNDFDPEKDRKVAFVFNMTKDWKAEWGGILQFLEEDGFSESGLIPTFNALNIFQVPQRHIVSQVSTYAPKVRFGLTGWFMGSEDG
ncbi:MAG: 2OG-Fe(II) oxygenase family protein [Sphingomonadales bacterium]